MSAPLILISGIFLSLLVGIFFKKKYAENGSTYGTLALNIMGGFLGGFQSLILLFLFEENNFGIFQGDFIKIIFCAFCSCLFAMVLLYRYGNKV